MAHWTEAARKSYSRRDEGFVATYVRRALDHWGWTDAQQFTDDPTEPATVTFTASLPDGSQASYRLTVTREDDQSEGSRS